MMRGGGGRSFEAEVAVESRRNSDNVHIVGETSSERKPASFLSMREGAGELFRKRFV